VTAVDDVAGVLFLEGACSGADAGALARKVLAVVDARAARLADADERTRTVVFRALDNAVANGYEVAAADVEAADLAGLDADLEGVLPEQIAPHVAAWRAARLADDMAALVMEGWWHPNVKGGQVHDHPEAPGRSWSRASHRLCEPVYTHRETDRG
jgi:hypothetical protein